VLALALAMAATGCQYLPSLPANPFSQAATPTPSPTAAPVLPPPSPAAFTPFWIKNHRITEMWSGPVGQEGVVSFGLTSSQFCSFQVVRPQDNARLYVLNPYSKNYLWIDADAIGPAPSPPVRRPGPRPSGQNCAEAIYDD
jgi:hypothetical protein